MPLFRHKKSNNPSPPSSAVRKRLSDSQRENWLRLIRTKHVGPVTFWRMINYFGSAEKALNYLPEFLRRAGHRPTTPPSRRDIEHELKAARKTGAQLVARGEPGYPLLLTYLEAPPPLLYVMGDVDIASRPAIAMVGSRNGSVVGQKFTRKIAKELGREGYAIVSGLARGIDTAAHKAALESGTIAVIAGGIDNYYPPQNIDLQNNIGRSGLVVTENPPGFEPRARDFPRRNRIIAGASLATLVVEANLRSGSLITARLATEQGREVMAVPGHPLDPRAAGTNRLIRNGATMITKTDDIIEALNPLTGPAPSKPPLILDDGPEPPFIDKVDVEQSARNTIVEALSLQAIEIDELIRCTGLSAREVRIILLELELSGRIQHDGAQMVRLIPQ